jgi:adenylate cyclase
MGDTTNLAARLQTVAQTGEVVIGQRTREELGEGALVEDLDPLSVKGKSDLIAAYRLVEAR